MIKRSQAISMDIMLAVVIFIGAIFLVYIFLNSNQQRTAGELGEEASKVLQSITSEDPEIGIVKGIDVDEIKLEQLLDENYETIKEKIRIDKDFCIFLEDEIGNVIYIRPGEPGVGSHKIQISDNPCG
jgi:hypothetical protein